MIDLANKWLYEEENLEIEDDELLEKIRDELANNKKEREALRVKLYFCILFTFILIFNFLETK